jgi:hypothetical protein
MIFFTISTLADSGSSGFCFLDTLPGGIGPASYLLSEGESLAEDYDDSASWKLSNAYPGLKKPSLIGNTCQILVFHREVADVVRAHNVGDLEIWPFTLLNHRGRVHSTDYVFVNPIGSIDCLNIEHTRFDRRDDGSVFNIDHIVLDKHKLTDAPDLFRICEDPTIYVISERLANAFAEKGFTNIVLQELEVA